MREQWGSRFGFIMTTAGFAIGLGNVWRFPYIVGENGGGAFLIVYLLCCILIGVPLFTAEISLGRKTQLTPVAGMQKLTGKRLGPWNLIGWLGVLAALLIMSFYPMVIGWVIAYFVKILKGDFVGMPAEQIDSAFGAFISRPGPVFGYTYFIIILMGVIVASGLRSGVEKAATMTMPILFVMMVGLAIRSLSFPGAMQGLKWYLQPDISVIDGRVVYEALAHAFFSIGIGMAGAFGFGSYLHRTKSNVPGNAAIVVAFDTGVAFLAGLVIFPAVFAFGLEPAGGTGLLFKTMPNLFNHMPAGRLFGTVLFLLMILAGVTSALALIEVLTASFSDSFGWTRKKAVGIVSVLLLILAAPLILSQGPWSRIQWRGLGIFDIVDTLSGKILLTLGGLLISLYTAYVWGFKKFQEETNEGSGAFHVGKIWQPSILAIIPISVAVIMVWGIVDTVKKLIDQ